MQAPAGVQRSFSSWRLYASTLLLGLAFLPGRGAAAPNLLVITVDDMSCDSVGAFGCRLADATPHIDRLAAEGLRFQRAFVQVGNCMPSRNVLWSGRYPHRTGVEGFYQVRSADYPHLVDLLQAAGYFTAIRGKVTHSTPYSPYRWDLVLDDAQGKPHLKDPASYGESVRLGLERSRAAGKPFALVINVSDPHKPFYGMGPRDMLVEDPHKPSRIFTPEEVPIPGFLFDHPDVRVELAHYYSSVRRADDCVGEILKALDDSGRRDETLVVFLSDHGMPLPFAKTGLWYHSTRTPLIVRWPGITRPGAVDTEHLVSAVDLLPTILDALQVRSSAEFDGRSFLPLLRGESQPGWDVVFTEHNENAGGNRNPMRGVVTRRFLYLYNPWVNGARQFATATRGTVTYRTMKKLAPQDPALAARLAHLELGVPEEFYDYENDPDARQNLIDDPRYQDEIARHRQLLEEWMVRTGDHALEAFRQRGDRAAQEAYLQRLEAEAAERNKAPRRNRAAVPDSAAAPGAAAPPQRRRGTDYLTLLPPQELPAGGEIAVVVRHRLPAELGPQPIHVTLKQGRAGRRVDRKVLTATGDGEATATFQLPAAPTDGVVSFAAFVGQDFGSSLQHVAIPPRAVTVPDKR